MSSIVRGRVVVFIFSSAGELDVVLPMLKVHQVDDYRILTFKDDANEKISADSFYRSVIGDRLVNSCVKYSPNKAVRWLQFLGNAIRTTIRYRSYDLFCFEYGGAGREKNILVLFLTMLGRAPRILFHPHGHAVTDDGAYARERQPSIVRFATGFGSRILKVNGVTPSAEFVALKYPILHPVWRKLVAEGAPSLFENHIVILSRDVHPRYLLQPNRLQMFEDVVHLVGKWFPTSRIVVKAHPREKVDEELRKKLPANATITYENTYSVVRGAKFAVSFWTSAFFQCMALDVPVVEYHIAHAEFRSIYPQGSLNRAFIPSFDQKNDLEAYLRQFV